MRIISYANLTSPSTIHSSFIPHSPWESSGEIATDEAQKAIPPVTATETSTGALEGAQVETILKTTPATTVSCINVLLFLFFLLILYPFDILLTSCAFFFSYIILYNMYS